MDRIPEPLDLPEIADIAQTVEFSLLMLAFLILAGPFLAEKARFPGLVGLIFLGMLFGQFVLGWILPAGTGVVGAIGLLYLMFLAGVELDLKTFIANRRASISFGLLTFAIPFGLSSFVGIQYLDYTGAAAALVGAMWASHTLVAYTEVKSAGLESNRAVGAAVSATVITDVLALIVLGFAASADVGETARTAAHVSLAVMPVWAGILVVGGFCMWVLPKATGWFFSNVGHTRVQRFVWILGGMAAGAFVSLLGGMEGLVGAFLAGLGMNRQIPAHGVLMEKVEFFGAALFVPAFLIAVGMSIDPRALSQMSTIRLALIFSALVVVGKALAAVVAGLVFRFSWAEIGMMTVLTIGQAAATLAIAQVGVNTGIFDQEVLNAAVIAVVITVIITSLGTRFFSRRIEPPAEDLSAIGKHVLVAVPSDRALTGELDVGVAVTRADDGLLTPFIVCEDGACDTLALKLEEAVQGAMARGHDSEGVTRIDQSLVQGALSLSAERNASMMVLPWEGPTLTGRLFFGNHIDEIGAESSIPVVAARILEDTWTRVLYFSGLTRGLQAREDSLMALDLARRVAEYKNLELIVYTNEPDTVEELDKLKEVHPYDRAKALASIASGDLVVVPAHAAETALGLGMRQLLQTFEKSSLLILGGPGRLRIARQQYGDRVLGGAGINRRDRENLGDRWEEG